jgi:hypothetical protein
MSSEASSDDEPQQPLEELQQAKKRYKITRKAFVKNIEIRPESDGGSDASPPALVIRPSNFKRHQANLTLHQGPDSSEASPAVARVHMPAFSRHFKVGICRPGATAEDMEWEDLKQANLRASEFSLQINLNADGDSRRQCLWKRTSHVAVDGQKAKRANHNWKLVDNDEGGEKKTILAVFTSTTRRNTSGTLQFNVDWGTSFEWMVMITLVTLYEGPFRIDVEYVLTLWNRQIREG